MKRRLGCIADLEHATRQGSRTAEERRSIAELWAMQEAAMAACLQGQGRVPHLIRESSKTCHALLQPRRYRPGIEPNCLSDPHTRNPSRSRKAVQKSPAQVQNLHELWHRKRVVHLSNTVRDAALYLDNDACREDVCRIRRVSHDPFAPS